MSGKFICLTLCTMLFGLCLPASAQQPKKVYRLGYLTSADPARDSARAEAIRLALRELGYIEGQNMAIEYRYGEAKPERAPELAAELVRLRVDIIVVSGGNDGNRLGRILGLPDRSARRVFWPILSS